MRLRRWTRVTSLGAIGASAALLLVGPVEALAAPARASALDASIAQIQKQIEALQANLDALRAQVAQSSGPAKGEPARSQPPEHSGERWRGHGPPGMMGRGRMGSGGGHDGDQPGGFGWGRGGMMGRGSMGFRRGSGPHGPGRSSGRPDGDASDRSTTGEKSACKGCTKRMCRRPDRDDRVSGRDEALSPRERMRAMIRQRLGGCPPGAFMMKGGPRGGFAGQQGMAAGPRAIASRGRGHQGVTHPGRAYRSSRGLNPSMAGRGPGSGGMQGAGRGRHPMLGRGPGRHGMMQQGPQGYGRSGPAYGAGRGPLGGPRPWGPAGPSYGRMRGPGFGPFG